MIFQKKLFVRYRVIDSKPYLINKNDAFILDDVGKMVWELIDGENTTETITNVIAKQYNVDANTIKVDIEKFIQDLHKNGLIELVV